MTSSLNMIRGRSNIVTLTNNSGGALIAGDVCVQDTSADEKVTTTTSAASVLKIFVAAESIASGAAGRFYESGYCPLVNVNASVTRGRFLFTHTVAKQAAENATYGSGAFGKILKSGTTPSAIIYSATAQISGTGVTRSGSTTDGHFALWNGADADSIKDGIMASASYKRTSADYTSTSDTFVDIDGTNMSLTITTGAHRVLIGLVGTGENNSVTPDNILIDFTVDGTRVGGDLGLLSVRPSSATTRVNLSCTYLTNVLSAASHTFKVQWRRLAAGTITLHGLSTDSECQFYVMEQAG